MQRTRGFVTIATGNERYYQLAVNLLRSFREKSTEKIPFAIICDRANDMTSEFDDIVVLERAYCSYMDKLYLFEYTPYDETIFVDADSLFLKDPKMLWADFRDADDFSAYGKRLPLESNEGWFEYDSIGQYKKDVSFGISMHGGLYYLRKTERCKEIVTRARFLVDNYQQYRFAHFSTPADEPVLALSMAISGAEPCIKKSSVIFLPSYEGRLSVDVNGNVYVDRLLSDAIIIHFATGNTCRFMYRYLSQMHTENGAKRGKYWQLRLKCLKHDIVIPNKRRLKRFVKYYILKRVPKRRK